MDLGEEMFRLLIIIFIFLPIITVADDDDCMACHEYPDLVSEAGKSPKSVFIDISILKNSIHKDFECINCHSDVDPDDLPHNETLESVFCGNCHDDPQLEFDTGIHGMERLMPQNVQNAMASMKFYLLKTLNRHHTK